jgi:glycerophosphoryl diester phosphodiesterase
MKKYRTIKLVEFEIAYKIVFFSILYMLVFRGLQFVMKLTGIRYLTNSYIYKFMTMPQTILWVLLVILYYGLGTMFELNCVDILVNLSGEEKTINWYDICRKSFFDVGKVLKPSNLVIIPFCLVTCFFMNIPVVLNAFWSNNATEALFKYIKPTTHLMLAAALVVGVLFLIVLFGFFTLNFFMNQEDGFAGCYMKSMRMVRRHIWKIIGHIVLFNLAIVLFYAAVYIIVSLVVIVGVRLLGFTDMGIAVYLTVIRLFMQGTGVFVFMMSIPVSYIVITKQYHLEMKARKLAITRYRLETSGKQSWKRRMISIGFVGFLAADILFIVYTGKMNVYNNIEIFGTTQITAHRGSSRQYPENTMPAFEQAVEELADYIELDVRQTADGQFVVLHDLSLRRTTGLSENVSDLTLLEIQELDAGSWKSEEFTGEKIPTLRQVLEYARGVVKLNIEAKINENDVDFAENLVELLEEYDMTEQCIVSSFDYDVLKEIKLLNEDIRTGYILSMAYGDYFSMDYVDFFSINYGFASSEMVQRAHEAGKEVHVWTVNGQKSMKRMLEIGVDNIITDNAVLARKVIYTQKISAPLLEMLEYVFDR